jgi:2-dehydro-3-deoxygluconokinase
MAMAEVVCIGETMAMVVPVHAERLELARAVAIHTGGAESNVAMYLAGLGHQVTWVSRLGDDPLGRRVLADVAAAGVDTSLVELDKAAPTGVYFKDPGPGGTRVYYYRRGSAASLMTPDILRSVLALPPRVVHVSGITPALSPTCDQMMSALFACLEGTTTLVSFDVNFRPALWGPKEAAPRLRALAQRAGVVFVGLDEAQTLWGTHGPREVRGLLTGPPVLVVKDGATGATAFDGAGEVFVPCPPVAVSEPVGAGDAFAAGWLSGLLQGLPQVKRLRLGHVLAGVALASTADHQAPPPPDLLAAALSVDEAGWAAGPEAWARAGKTEALAPGSKTDKRDSLGASGGRTGWESLGASGGAATESAGGLDRGGRSI